MIKHVLLAQLIHARESGALIADVPDSDKPATLDEAYATADALAKALGQPVAGWKIGASTRRGWERLGLSEPFGGRIFADTVYATPASLPSIPGTLTIGAEFALRIARDLLVDETAFTGESIRAVIDAVFPVLELNHPSYETPMEIGGLCLIADNGVNCGLVLGQPITGWEMLDLAALSVTMRLNGTEKSTGKASDIGFDPFAAVAWLANDRARRGDPLKGGQVVSSGDLIGPAEADKGDHIAADFGAYGVVELQL